MGSAMLDFIYKKLGLSSLSSTKSSSVPLQYLPVKTGDDETDQAVPDHTPLKKSAPTVCTMLLCGSFALLGIVALTRAAYLEKRASTSATASTTDVPQYFQLEPELYAGPTPTGRAPFLAETNPAPFGASRTFVPNNPLETALPIVGDTQNASIFHLMGQLSPYFPNPYGLGANEYPLPAGANISMVQMLHRHGSRYPTTGAAVQKTGTQLANLTAKGNTSFTGQLSFLNTWSYGLGAEILVAVGRQELFDSGVLHYYDYGHLYNTSTKIVARSTTQDRMTKSAEYFLAGFFGLQWNKNASLELIIEEPNFNNSLAGYFNCNNSNLAVSTGGTNASIIYQGTYLKNATARFNAMSGESFTWNTTSVYNAQTLCPYETVAFGYSPWCELFTYEEWQGFEYSIDLSFYGNNQFGSPTGRAVGIGYVEEVLARLNHHLITTATAQDNITLDSQPSTFPLNQTLYFDFSHDTNIAAILTAFGLTQFAQFLPTTGPPKDQQLIVSRNEPFGARLDIELITSPHPVTANRTYSGSQYTSGEETKYIHFILNQRTLPLGKSFAECGERKDGWCELSTFLKIQESSLEKAKYEFSCNGKYPVEKYGAITDGVPIATSAAKLS